MKKLTYLFLIIILIFTGGTFLYQSYQKGKTRREEYYSDTINNRSFYRKYKYTDFFHYDDKTQDDILNNNFQPQNVPDIITYGLNILIDVDNQNRSKDINEVNAQQKLTAQCDIQSIFDEEFNILDIAVSYTMVDKHDITQENNAESEEEELLKQELEEDGEDGEYLYEIYEQVDYEQIDTPQNYFYKLLVHADSGEVLLMQIEVNIEEEPILTYATQQLISDIFPELRKDSYEKSVLESDNFGTIQVDYTKQDVDEEFIIINKEFNDKDYVQKYNQVDYKVNYERNIVLSKEGIVNEGKTDMKFSFGQYNAVNTNLQQTEGDQEEEVEALGQITGDMDCDFWVVPKTEEDTMIAQEMFRYRQELQIFEDIRLAKDLKTNLEYGDGEAEPFELIDINEEHEIVTVEEEQVKSDKPNIYFGQYKKQNNLGKQKPSLQLYDDMAKSMRERSKQAAELKKRQEQEQQINEQIIQINKERQAIEEKTVKKIDDKIKKDQILEDKNKEKEETYQKWTNVKEELKKKQVELKNLFKQKQNLENSKIVVQVKISRLANDINYNYDDKVKELEEEQYLEGKQIESSLQVVQAVQVFGLNEEQVQLSQNLIKEIQKIQQLSQQYITQKSSIIIQIYDLFQNLMDISERVNKADSSSISDRDQLPPFQQFADIIDKILLILNDDIQIVKDRYSNFSQILKNVGELYYNVQTVQTIPQEYVQNFEDFNSQIQTFYDEKINNQQQQYNDRFIQLKDLWEEYYSIKENPVKISEYQSQKLKLKEEKNNLDKQIIKLSEEIKQASEAAVQAELRMQEAEQERIEETKKIEQKIENLQEQMQNLSEITKHQLEKIKNQIDDDKKDTIFDIFNKVKQELDLNTTVPSDQDEEILVSKTNTLAKVKVLGKEIGLDFTYNGSNVFYQIELKVRVDKKYVARVFQRSYKCTDYEDGEQYTKEKSLLKKDYRLFKAEYPVLGVITIPISADARVQYGYKYGIANRDQKCSLYFKPYLKASIYAEGAISIAKVVSAGIYAQGNFLDTSLSLEAKKDHGKAVLGLYAQFRAFSFEMGVTYTKISCSLENIKKDRRALQNIEDNQQNQLQQVRRNLGIIKKWAKKGKKLIKKTKKSLNKVVNKLKEVGQKVAKVAERVADVAKKAYEIASKLHKICKKDKGTKAICEFGSKPYNKTIWEKEINIGI